MFTQIQRRLADEVGALVGEFLRVFLKDSKLFASTTSTVDCSIEQVQRRRTLAWQVLCAFSEQSDGVTRRTGPSRLEGLRVRDETWSFSSEFRAVPARPYLVSKKVVILN